MATRNTEGGGARGGKTGGGPGGAAAGKGGAGGAGKEASSAGTTGARGGGAGRGASAGGKSASSRTPSKAGSSRAGSKTAASRGGSKSAGTAGTKKAAGSRGRGGAGTAAGKSAASAAGGGTQKLRSDLREFVQAHPGGWGHNEWIGLVNLLRERGHDTSDTDAIGMALERERLTIVLERVPGLGAQRVKAIADKYPRIWNVMQAGAEELAMVANVPKAVAKKVKDALP